jgi:hypothetical protein
LSLLVPTSGRPNVKFGRVGFGEAGNVDAEPFADSRGISLKDTRPRANMQRVEGKGSRATDLGRARFVAGKLPPST